MRGPSRIPETVGLPGALPALARSLAAHRFILRSLVRNEVLTRYSHTLLGVAWSLLNPLAMLLRGEAPDWRALGGYALAGAAMAWTGSWWFLRTRKGSADVM